MRKLLLILLPLACVVGCGRLQPPAPYGPCPTDAQLRWQRMEMNMFCHFGPNTFSDKEWGDGAEPEDLFNPEALDCSQWAAVAKAAGFRGIILTAKHHDGFCLWPNPASNHTVAQCAWRQGRGDVLRDLSDACRQAGLAFGVYISPWDRNAPTYGTPEYNQTFRLTLQSALSSYGPVFEQWFDGANGEGPNGKRQDYDWPLFNSTVAALQPQAVIFSDVGPGCRWMGNEQGVNGETCWSRLSIQGFAPGQKSPGTATLNSGQPDGTHWVPAETDVSLRPGWFFHPNEKPKTVEQLLGIYYTSIGRNSLLLLNVPPDRRGLVSAADSLRLMEFRSALDSIFSIDLAQGARVNASEERSPRFRGANLLDTCYDHYWAVTDDNSTPSVTLTFPEPVTFNRVMLQEYIPLGQRVEQFRIDVMERGQWRPLAQATTIGYKRILLTETVTAQAVRLTIESSLATPVINRLALYWDGIYQPPTPQNAK